MSGDQDAESELPARLLQAGNELIGQVFLADQEQAGNGLRESFLDLGYVSERHEREAHLADEIVDGLGGI